jgi:hypothetical protein
MLAVAHDQKSDAIRKDQSAPIVLGRSGTREHQPLLTTDFELKRWMLRARKGAAGGPQGCIVGVPIGLLKRDGAVVIAIGRTEESRNEGVGEEGAANFVRLLRVLVGRAGGQEGQSLAV